MKCVSDVEFAFNGVYREIINTAVSKGLKELLPPVFDKLLALLDGSVVLHKGISLDF